MLNGVLKEMARLIDTVYTSEEDRRELIKERDNMLEEIKKNA